MPVSLNVGLKFLKQHNLILNLKENTLKISKHEIEIPSSNFKNSLAIPDKIIAENVNKVEVLPSENEDINLLDKRLSEIKAKYEELNKELGLIPKVEHSIPFIENKNISCKPLNIPLNLRRETEREIQRLLRLGIIKKSNSLVTFSSFPLRKKDGAIRLVIDYRKPNQLTAKESYLFPNITDILNQLKEMMFYSQLDMKHS